MRNSMRNMTAGRTVARRQQPPGGVGLAHTPSSHPRRSGKAATAELLSQFCDNLLKKSGERLSDEALEDKLEKARAVE